MVHKVPGSEKWELAMRSRQLWENFADNIKSQGMDPEHVLGWKKTGTPYILRVMLLHCRTLICVHAYMYSKYMFTSQIPDKSIDIFE